MVSRKFSFRSDEAFRDAVARAPARNSASSRCRRTPPPVSQIVRPVVVPKTQPAGDALANRAEAGADALADRLQGLKSGPALGRMQADALGRAVIDGHEDEGRALDGHCGRHVRPTSHRGPRW